ncbi:protein of unknown function [Maridesulfovibrio hydrothermalis AM13 = DSM 14728]|uniref:Uncharacterized protein n=1 Tax=Maridesulfovibrio hydrothermalis AM13 = DSM 14728 TaxID=1121451 RepID=L0R6S7_9BACT|nr:protein of unknown function [Maridesulfovibrio hydrothermalis AM13 = DSM 14728]
MCIAQILLYFAAFLKKSRDAATLKINYRPYICILFQNLWHESRLCQDILSRSSFTESAGWKYYL